MKKLLLITLSIFISLAFPLFSDSFEEEAEVSKTVLDYKDKNNGKEIPSWALFLANDEIEEAKKEVESEDDTMVLVKARGDSAENAIAMLDPKLNAELESLAKTIVIDTKKKYKEKDFNYAYNYLIGITFYNEITWFEIGEVSNGEVMNTYYEAYGAYRYPNALIKKLKKKL